MSQRDIPKETSNGKYSNETGEEDEEPEVDFLRGPEAPLSNEPFEPPDGGWGWVVCLTSFWTNGTIFGILNTFGILMVEMKKEFDDGSSDLAFKTSWVGSLHITMTFMMSPLASIMVDRLGIRITAFSGAAIATTGMIASSFVRKVEILYLTYGVLLGLGTSLIYTPSMAILGHYFKRRLGIVNGLVTFGSAVFTLFLPFLEAYLLEKIGLFNTLRVLACFLATLLPCALTWKPLFRPSDPLPDVSTHKSTESLVAQTSRCSKMTGKVCNMDIWKNKGYVVWVIALPVAFLGYFVPFAHLPSHTEDTMPGANAWLLVTCLGATSGVSRLICGKISDFPKVNRVRMQQFSFLILGICTACIPFAKNFWVLAGVVLIMGICDGCFICLLGPIAFDLLGPAGAAQGIGCLLGLMSVPLTAGPPVAGILYDKMGTYDIAFFIAGAPPILGAILLFLMPYKKAEEEMIIMGVDVENLSLYNEVGTNTEETVPMRQFENGEPNCNTSEQKNQEQHEGQEESFA